ncbi:MAG TPA: hypothetical protein VD794_01645 [Flavisolibacter sp.]|nr:hypothetical protein [Flavisolibacter sp.]
MQKRMLVLLVMVVTSFAAQGQSLKELLYGGKLKMDSNTVVRKTDDLKSKIDTAQKKPAPAEKPVAAAVATDSINKVSAPTSSAVAATEVADSAAGTDTAAATEDAAPVAAAPVKTNTRIWKEYTDSLVNTLKAEVLSNKKIKKETYYITVGYEIDTTGQVNIVNVTSTPENALLQSQVKQRMEVTPPPLNPVLDSNNKPRKIKRNHNFSVTKD